MLSKAITENLGFLSKTLHSRLEQKYVYLLIIQLKRRDLISKYTYLFK